MKHRITVTIELKKGPMVNPLQKSPFVNVIPVHVLSLARNRLTFWPCGAKDYSQDAELEHELMLRYPKKIQAIDPTMRIMIITYSLALKSVFEPLTIGGHSCGLDRNVILV